MISVPTGQSYLQNTDPLYYEYFIEQLEVIMHSMNFMSSEQQKALYTKLKSVALPTMKISSPVNMYTLSASLNVNITLQDLTLSCDVDDHAIELLSVALQNNRSLCRLSFDCTITDAGARHLALMLEVNRSIEELDLSSSLISDDGVVYLSMALMHNNSLKELDLSYNKLIGDTGASGLSNMLQVNKSLKMLDLVSTSIGQEGVSKLLGSLLQNQVLSKLILLEELKMYCERHVLYERVESRICFMTVLC